MHDLQPAETAPASRRDAAHRQPDDIVLIQRLLHHDRDAFAMLYDRYAGAVHGLALMVLRDPALAEDVTHDVFLRLWQRPDAYDPTRGSFAPWLLRVARNRAIDLHRRRRTQPALTADEVAAWAPDPAPDPADQVITRQLRRQVQAALAGLTPDQRRLLELAYFSGMSQSQIAAQLERPLGTVKSQIRLAMRHMAGRLGDAAPGSEIGHG